MLITFTITGTDLGSYGYKNLNPHKDMKFRKLTIKSIDHNIYGPKMTKSWSSSVSGVNITRIVNSPLYLDIGDWINNDEAQDISNSDNGLIPMGYSLMIPKEDDSEGYTPHYERILCDYNIINHPTHWTTGTSLKFAFKYIDINTDVTPAITGLNNDADADSHITYDPFTFIRIVMDAELIDSH